jgi:uncharacterized SAM-binding protein YcdF (DUF218 family)
VVAAGNQPESEGQQIEAHAIAEMLVVLGVPRTAMRLEPASRNTFENAANAKTILDRLGVHRILLVTSAEHMPRAVKTFAKVWAGAPLELVPASTDVTVVESGHFSLTSCLPAVGALLNVTKSLKEYAGTLALAIM